MTLCPNCNSDRIAYFDLTCLWSTVTNLPGGAVWRTSCDNGFGSYDNDLDFKFCPYCGRSITVAGSA